MGLRDQTRDVGNAFRSTFKTRTCVLHRVLGDQWGKSYIPPSAIQVIKPTLLNLRFVACERLVNKCSHLLSTTN